MNLQLDQDVGSLAVFLKAQTDVPMYYDNLPASFKCPCLYFEPVRADFGTAALGFFKETRTQYVNVFHVSKREAQHLAGLLTRALALARYTVPLLREDLTPCGSFAVREPNITLIDTQMGVECAQVRLVWSTYETFTREEGTPIVRVHINPELKPG